MKQTEVDLKSATDKKESRLLYLETYGCQMNVADSEVVASIMQMDGYEITTELTEDDAILVIRLLNAIDGGAESNHRLTYFYNSNETERIL